MQTTSSAVSPTRQAACTRDPASCTRPTTRARPTGATHPEEREAILAGYGYKKVEADGEWSRGFENSRFIPDGRDGETWWVSSFGGVRWTELGTGQADPKFATASVQLSGYLSTPGRHGHMGQYTRELMATGFTVATIMAP